MNDRIFIDTNIWIYAHLDQDNDKKGTIASRLVEVNSLCVVSTQVLNEYYNTMVRNKVDDLWIGRSVEAIIKYCEVRLITLDVIRKAHSFRTSYRFSYWDCLMLASAREAGCSMFYSEDLQHNQLLEGNLRIINPFV
ncbi:MAG: PIN domain-containing protein [Magnetococcales bacterium]|nr:PIN domain-containing protein [Magnetococcales bacterium]